MRTRFTDLVGCRYPLQNAGMGAVGSPGLAAAVARAGGLGMMGAGLGEVPETDGKLGVNFLAPGGFDLEYIGRVAPQVRVVEFFYGDPSPAPVRAAHSGGALVSWQVGSVAEAVAACECGSDLIVAQGIEAGGHVRGKVRLDALLPSVLAAVKVPVVAAGGIASPERVRAVMDAGADAVRVGTRFVAATECDAHPDYVRRLIEADGPADTELTLQFDQGWPDAPHRALRSAVKAAQRARFHGVAPPTRGERGPVDHRALYAGEGVGHVKRAEAASDIVADLVSLLD